MMSNRELWIFFLGYGMAKDDPEEMLQNIVKYQMICRKLGITPLDIREMGALKTELIITLGTGAQAMQKEDIWQKKP